jgi:hypothetical protein
MSATSITPGARERVRRGRRGAIVVVVVLATALLLAWVGRGASRGYLDPDAYNDAGSRAVVELLREQGVDVVKATRSDDVAQLLKDSTPTTLLVAIPDLLDEQQVETITAAEPEAWVLVAPGDGPLLDAVAPGVSTAGVNDEGTVLEPACTWPAATRAGRADAAGATYRIDPSATQARVQACYVIDDRASVVHQGKVGRSVTVLGDPAVLQNDTLAREGNAALALNALGENGRVIWYLPSIADTGAEEQSFLSLAPDWVLFAVVQLGFVVVLLAFSRVRRFGPVIAEPLPAVVPAAETVEGRGRLYRKSGARGTAADTLRAGTLERVRQRCGLPRGSTVHEIIDTAGRITGRNARDLTDLLTGPAPTNDAELIALAQNLRTFEKELP